MSGRSLLQGSCALAALALAAMPALAQDGTEEAAPQAAAKPALPGIVVTAQLRPQPLEAVPMAVSALLSGEIEARGIDEPLELVRGIPNVAAAHVPGFGSDNSYAVRGLSGVGTFVDGIYLGRGAATNFGFFDIDRAEVLRGPQGPLYGRDTSAGAINIINRTPGDRLSGYIDGAYGRFGTYQFRGGLDVPVAADRFSLGISGYWRESNGYVRNPTTGDRLNEDDGYGVRLAAHLKATETLTWTASLTKMESTAVSVPDFECNPADAADCKGRFSATGLPEHVNTDHFAPLAISGRKAGYGLGNDVDTWLATSAITWALGDAVTLSAITGYVDTKRQYAVDLRDGRSAPTIADPVPAARADAHGGYTILGDTHFKQFSQELRLSGALADGLVNYVAGVSYTDEDGDSDLADVVTAAVGPSTLLADRRVLTGTKTTAGFAQVDVNATEALTLTAGLRYTDEELSFSVRDNRAECALLAEGCLDDAALVSAGIPAKIDSRFWTPRFAASFKAAENATLFASATRGYRSAGWNERGTTTAAIRPYAAEKIWSYEAGLRSTWLERRLAVNLTGFYVDGSDVQVGEDLLTDSVPGFENKGLELEIAAVPFTNVNVHARAGWQDAKYKPGSTIRAQQAACAAELAAGLIAGADGTDNAPSCGTGIVTAAGDIADPVRAPKWTLSAGASWDIWLPPVSGSIVTPSVEVNYRSAMETGSANSSLYTGSVTGVSDTVYPANPYGGGFITGSRAKAQVLVNAGLALRTDDNFWRVSVECENCLNETAVDASLGTVSWLSTPRVWMFRARRQF